MYQAQFIGTVSFDFLDRSDTQWRAMTTEDIFQENLISKPSYYLHTLGSGVYSAMTSLATTPTYHLPTDSQFYLAGRDVFRWGGPSDPYEIDIDHYGFTPDYKRRVTVMWKAPKSEPHHLSEMPNMMNSIPAEWKEIYEAIFKKQLP